MVRDNQVGGGGVDYDTVTLNVTSTAGPFTVTAPNTADTWNSGSSQTTTWNVASTNLLPVNCPAVNILLSTDGGNTFPTTLASGTPNDGAETITVPNLSSELDESRWQESQRLSSNSELRLFRDNNAHL